jgi:dCTP deaminase
MSGSTSSGLTDTTPRRGRPAGLLPAQAIRALIAAGRVSADAPISETQIQPASLDLRLGVKAYRVRASFLPGRNVSVADKLAQFALHEIDLRPGAVLETGCVYVAPLMERLALAPDVSALANPKSSTGRLDVFTRVIANGGNGFDQAPRGYSGPLYAEICPQTFPVLVRTGSSLAQIRFRQGEEEAQGGVLLDPSRALWPGAQAAAAPGGVAANVFLSVHLCGDDVVGYRAKRYTGLIDIDREGGCVLNDFWEPIYASERRLILDPDQFYILASKEAVHVPPTHAAEMIPFNPLVGEFRVHYAGFFDPGFGHAASGGAGSRAVLEVRSHKAPFILEDGQIVGSLLYEQLTEEPDQIYGSRIGSHYQAQGLKLSKHFR